MDPTTRPHRRSTRLAALASAIVLVTASGYMVVYIARWEWTRALISASVFTAMLSIVSTALVLTRISELARLIATTAEQRHTGDATAEHTPGPIADAPACDRPTSDDRRFEWLRRGDDAGVFIPVLLGAGMIVSALGWLVERISVALAGGSLDPRIGTAIPLDLPLGGQQQRVVAPGRDSARPAQRPRRTLIIALVAAVTMMGLGVEELRRLTQSDPTQLTLPGRSSIVLDVHSTTGRSAAEVATVLWSVCAQHLVDPPAITAIAEAGPFVAIHADRALGTTAIRMMVGCLEDFTLDRVVADVVELTTSLSTAGGSPDTQSSRSNLLQRWMPNAVSS